MEIKRKHIAVAVINAIAVMAVSSAYAQSSDPQKVERVEVTGSSIKRIAAEGALPIQVITQEEIKRSGATSVTDLVQKLPAMQGFVAQADSVNGGGGGLTTASLRSLGSDYTLVLLNGRRVGAANKGTAVNLQSIPLAAIERVEILTDGASAIYGADAIAGVVNFILKKNSTEGAIDLNVNVPEHSGGQSFSFSATKGFGSLAKDGYNVVLSYSRDEQKSVAALQRGFASSGVVPFTAPDGKPVAMVLNSINSVPANIILYNAAVDDVVAQLNPFFLDNAGKCPPLHVARGTVCRFDFASTVDLVPASTRDSFFGSGQLKLNANTTLFGDVVYSKYQTTPRFAPPAQPLELPLNSALYAKYVLPRLAGLGLKPADVGLAEMYIRVFDAGTRRDKYAYDSLNLVGGIEGSFAKWDYNAGYTFSRTKITDDAIGGYLSKDKFLALVAQNRYDPFLVAGGAVAALAPAVLNQRLSTDKTALDSITARASRPLMALAGGDVSLGLGVEYSRQGYSSDPSAILQGANPQQPTFTDAIIGGGGGSLPFDASRSSYGAFAELVVPVSKQLEVTGAVRYDNFGAVSNGAVFDASGKAIGSGTQGKSADKATYKLSARFQPSNQLLFRGSVGSGFRAPTLGDISNPVEDFGVTAAEYTCPFPASDPLSAGCPGAQTQYNQVRRGNATTGSLALKPEQSQQWTLGFRVEPIPAISLGLDYWNVSLKDQISQIDERVAFANPAAFRELFLVRPDPISGVNRLNFVLAPINLSRSRYRGIDLDATVKNPTPIGELSARVAATYLMQADYEVPGLPGFQSSLGKYGVDQQVAFRLITKLSLGLQAGRFGHTLTANHRTGYTDAPVTTAANGDIIGPVIRPVNANGTFGGQIGTFTRSVRSHITLDWQTRFDFNKQATFTVGVKNLLDRDPPFSIQDGGTGNMRGYDPRYSDALGRTYYANLAYKF